MGSAAMTTPRGGYEDDGEILAGVLNLLGEGFNPFEFLPQQPQFLECYEKLLFEWNSMKWQEVSGYVDMLLDSSSSSEKVAESFNNLRLHCEQSEEGGNIATFFKEKVLENDNKYLDHRCNLITFAMRPHGGDENIAQWELLEADSSSKPPWLAEMVSLITVENGSYSRDPRILCWDLCCCILAQRQQQPYLAICGMSHLNPANETGGEGFFDAAACAAGVGTSTRHMPLILGLLEWPAQASRTQAFLNTCERRKLTVTLGNEGSGVAMVSSSSLGSPISLTHNGAHSLVKPREIMEKVIQDIHKDSNEQLSKKETDGLIKTTAVKTLGCMVPLKKNTTAAELEPGGKWLICIVVHSKEPKNALAVRAFSLFLSRMVLECQNRASDALLIANPHLYDEEQICSSDFTNFVVMTDTNIASLKMSQVFREELRDLALEASPADPSVCTTRKRRSRLHGQCYDNNKCHVTVAAPKDCVITSQGRFTQSECVFPNINTLLPTMNEDHSKSPFGDTLRTLPDSDWMSDHCIVTSPVKIRTGPRVLIRPDCVTKVAPPSSPGARSHSRSFHSGFFDEDSGDEEVVLEVPSGDF